MYTFFFTSQRNNNRIILAKHIVQVFKQAIRFLLSDVFDSTQEGQDSWVPFPVCTHLVSGLSVYVGSGLGVAHPFGTPLLVWKRTITDVLFVPSSMFLPQCLTVKQTSSGKASLSLVQFLRKPLPPLPYASPLPQLIPIFWMPYGLAESWHGALRSEIILGVAPDHSPGLFHFTFCGNRDVPGNRGLDLFLLWLEPIASHWHWHTLSDLRAAFQFNEVYWEGILSMCSQMILFFCAGIQDKPFQEELHRTPCAWAWLALLTAHGG